MTTTDLAAALLRDARDEIHKAIHDPGKTEGKRGDRTLTAWQTDAVMQAVLSALSRALDHALTERAGEEVAEFAKNAAIWEGYAGAPTCPTFSRGDARYWSERYAKAADLITALLAQIAALRAEQDACPIGMSDEARDLGLCSAATCRVCLGRHMAAWRARAEAAEAVAEKLRGALEKIATLDDTAECCGHGVCGGYSPPECCDQPLCGLDRAQQIARAALTTEADNDR